MNRQARSEASRVPPEVRREAQWRSVRRCIGWSCLARGLRFQIVEHEKELSSIQIAARITLAPDFFGGRNAGRIPIRGCRSAERPQKPRHGDNCEHGGNGSWHELVESRTEPGNERENYRDFHSLVDEVNRVIAGSLSFAYLPGDKRITEERKNMNWSATGSTSFACRGSRLWEITMYIPESTPIPCST